MSHGFVLPATKLQRFLNRLANAELGEVVTDHVGRAIKKIGHDEYRVLNSTMAAITLDELRSRWFNGGY